VIARGDDLYGDTVNVAARLQALAEPGQIYISAGVHEQIAGKPGFSCQFVGERMVKNIARPVLVYNLWTPPAARCSGAVGGIGCVNLSGLSMER
jgi:adenylate cyclase